MENEKWIDVEDGSVVKLEVGQELTEKLVAKRSSENGGIYDIEGEQGLVTVFGTTILDQKMKQVPERSTVRIKRLDDKPSSVKGRNPMQVFGVQYMAGNGE